MGMIENSGVFKLKGGGRTELEWAVEWVPKIRNSGGKFTGVSWGPDTAPSDPALASFFVYNPKGGYFEGGDAKLDDLTLKIVQEFDIPSARPWSRSCRSTTPASSTTRRSASPAASGWSGRSCATPTSSAAAPAGWTSTTGSELKAWIDETQAPKGNASGGVHGHSVHCSRFTVYGLRFSVFRGRPVGRRWRLLLGVLLSRL